MTLLSTISKWGNGQGIRLPKTLLELLKWENNDKLEIIVENENIRIQDIIYYVWSNPIFNKSRIESLEYVLSQYSAKYVKYPDKKPINKFKEDKNYVDKIQGVIQIHVKDEEVKIEKNQLPEKYDKYMQGIKDIDEIIIKVSKKQPSELQKTRCENLIRELGKNTAEYEKTYSINE